MESFILLDSKMPTDPLHPDRYVLLDAGKFMALYNAASKFNTLPEVGGVNDQDCYTMMGLMLVGEVVDKKSQKDIDDAKAKQRG